MKEEFLHYVWKHQLFPKAPLITVNNQKLRLLKPGTYNAFSGPDFFNATIVVDDLIWVGNIEVHVRTSDWYLHNHEKDENYDSVILHVVWKDDVELFDKNNKPISTLELSSIVSRGLVENYYNLYSRKLRWIPCENQIKEVDSFTIENWKTRLYFERLEQKSILIKKLLGASQNDYEAVLFQLLAKNFGLNVNGEAFLKLATSFDFSILRKVQNDVIKIEALLFGQAGFLVEVLDNSYYLVLKEEYKYLQHKFQLKPIHKSAFEFFRLRPSNFPTIKIALLAALYHKHQNMFSKFLNCVGLEDYYQLFKIDLNEFWDTHFTFHKEANKRKKRFTKSFIDLLLINTIIPLQFMYLKSRVVFDEEQFLLVLKQIQSEKNGIVSKFSALGIQTENALDTQALIQLKNNYCAKKRCLQCAIGNKLLRKNLV